MKKIAKKITAIMLSLAMLLGCVPNFTNVASAEPLIYFVTIDNFEDGSKVEDISISTFNVNANQMQTYSLDSSLSSTVSIQVYENSNMLSSTDTLSIANDYKLKIIASDPASFKLDSNPLNAFVDGSSYAVSLLGITNWLNGSTTFSIDSNVLTITMYLYADTTPVAVSTINLEECGELCVDPVINSISYKVSDDDKDKYEINVVDGWFTTDSCQMLSPIEFGKDVYKKINIIAKDGYEFDNTMYVDCNGNNTATITRVNDEKAYVIVKKSIGKFDGLSVNYEKPTNLEELAALDSSKITVQGAKTECSTDKELLYDMSNIQNHLGVYVLITSISFGDADAVEQLPKKFYLREEDISDKYEPLYNQVLAKADSIDCAVSLSNSGKTVVFIEKFDFSETANFNATLNAGMKVSDVISSITYDVIDEKNILDPNDRDYLVIVDSEDDDTALDGDAVLEAGKTYYLYIMVKKTKYPYNYNKLKFNGSYLDFVETPSQETESYYSINNQTKDLCVVYKFTPGQSGGTSKKYKADDKDTAKDVLGTGKKGSTRTIVPEAGRKVTNVKVTDKKGNPIEVTMNEDGTYSFIQPASDVIIDVDYQNREIMMEVGIIGATVDGIAVNEYVTPKVRGNEVMLPVRFIAENLGAKVDWNEKEPNMIYITRGDKKIEIKLGSNVFKVNGEEFTLDSASFAEGNRTYVPFKLIEKALNATVELGSTNSNEIAIKEF